MAKKYDAVVGLEYTTAQGETKTKWQNVGAVVTTQKGGFMLLLDRTFNPAGIPNPENRTNIVVNLFEPQDRNGQQPAPQSSAQQYRGGRQGGAKPDPGFDDDLNEDVPF